MKTKTGTREWAERTCNVQVGCEHDCKYCYAKAMAIRFGRATADDWSVPRPPCMKKMTTLKTPMVTMFPSTHDVTEQNAEACGRQIERILMSGDQVLLVTKARMAALRCATAGMRTDRIEVRVTIGSADDMTLKFWEPGAPSFKERIDALRWAKEAGFKTSLSMEPMLDGSPLLVVAAAMPHVTGDVWLGLARNLAQRVAVNCPGDKMAALGAKQLDALWHDERVMALYGRLKKCAWAKWKDSVMEVVGRVQIPDSK